MGRVLSRPAWGFSFKRQLIFIHSIKYVNNLSTSNSALEKLYDTYGPMVYGIALDLSANEQEAEELLIRSFQKADSPQLFVKNHVATCMALIKLVISIARERLNNSSTKRNFRLSQFEKNPLLHKFLCEQVSMESHCIENGLTRPQAMKQIREEFLAFNRTERAS